MVLVTKVSVSVKPVRFGGNIVKNVKYGVVSKE